MRGIEVIVHSERGDGRAGDAWADVRLAPDIGAKVDAPGGPRRPQADIERVIRLSLKLGRNLSLREALNASAMCRRIFNLTARLGRTH
jgi:hypothetical protein